MSNLVTSCQILDNYPITIFNDIDSYAKKVKSISTPNDKTALIDKHILEKITTTCV